MKLAEAAVATVTITKYQCKKSKSVNILSSLHPNVAIPSENNLKQYFFTTKLRWESMFLTKCQYATL